MIFWSSDLMSNQADSYDLPREGWGQIHAKFTLSLPYRILSFQILGNQNRAKTRFGLGGIANSDKIEQIRSEVMHFRKLCFPGAATQRLSLRNNSPHQTATFAYFSHICEAK